jgi:hypothetical protein
LLGGSVTFGGPQASDGYIQLVGNNFVMEKGNQNKHNFIAFLAPEYSYLRIYIYVEYGMCCKTRKRMK